MGCNFINVIVFKLGWHMLAKVILIDVGKSRFFTWRKMFEIKNFSAYICGQSSKKMLTWTKCLISKSLKWCCNSLICTSKGREPFQRCIEVLNFVGAFLEPFQRFCNQHNILLLYIYCIFAKSQSCSHVFHLKTIIA